MADEIGDTCGNYVKFSINAGGFTLTATPGTSTNATPRAPVHAIQIVPSSSAGSGGQSPAQ